MAVSKPPVTTYYFWVAFSSSATDISALIGEKAAVSNPYNESSASISEAPNEGKTGETITVTVMTTASQKFFKTNLVVPADAITAFGIKYIVLLSGKSSAAPSSILSASQFTVTDAFAEYTINYVSEYKQPEPRIVRPPSGETEYYLTSDDLPQLDVDLYELEGWYQEAAFENKLTTGMHIGSNATFYGKWVDKPSKTVQPVKLINGQKYNLMFETKADAVFCQNRKSVETELKTKASLISPALAGTPTAPTAPIDTNTTQIATTAFVNNVVEENPGKNLAGQTVRPTNGSPIVAGIGAEIFNDYRERTFDAYSVVTSGNIASGMYSHAEGQETTAHADCSHAEGYSTHAAGNSAHAEGYDTTASDYSHAEGYGTMANGDYSHAEGYNTRANGSYSHAEGYNTSAKDTYSHAEGLGTVAKGTAQHAQGKYNMFDTAEQYAHIVGNGYGEGETERSNAHTLDWDGNAWFAGKVSVGETAKPVQITLTTDLTTKKYVDDLIAAIEQRLVAIEQRLTDAGL